MRDADGLRTRLEALNRGALPVRVRAAEVREAGVRRESAAVAAAAPSAGSGKGTVGSGAWRAGIVRAIPGLVRRGQAIATGGGECVSIHVALDDLWTGGEELVRRRCAALAAAMPQSERDDGKRGSIGDAWWNGFPERVAMLDLETCGLAGSAVFLAGILRAVDGRLAVELLLARDYSEEAAVLDALWQRLVGVETLVTFNGKSFDWPMVVDRSRRHLLGVTWKPSSAGRLTGKGGPVFHHSGPLPEGAGVVPRHVDLLHLARRRWRRELPDCKLQTLERHVCGRLRADDLPSKQIPAAYQQYVRTKFEREMDQVLLHNAIDLVTMLDLAMRLAG